MVAYLLALQALPAYHYTIITGPLELRKYLMKNWRHLCRIRQYSTEFCDKMWSFTAFYDPKRNATVIKNTKKLKGQISSNFWRWAILVQISSIVHDFVFIPFTHFKLKLTVSICSFLNSNSNLKLQIFNAAGTYIEVSDNAKHIKLNTPKSQ